MALSKNISIFLDPSFRVCYRGDELVLHALLVLFLGGEHTAPAAQQWYNSSIIVVKY